jgi:hypothetical protein
VVSDRAAANAMVLSFMIISLLLVVQEEARKTRRRSRHAPSADQFIVSSSHVVSTGCDSLARNRNYVGSREFPVWVAEMGGLAQPHLNPPKAPRVGLCSPSERNDHEKTHEAGHA